MNIHKILVGDQDPEILDILATELNREGYLVLSACDGEELLQKVEVCKPDLIMVRLELPKLDGMEVCRRIRSYSSIPIMVFSNSNDQFDRILALRCGADDFISIPFVTHEVLLKVKAILRRSSTREPYWAQSEVNEVRVGKLIIDRRHHLVWNGDQCVQLTAREFDLLWMLASSPGAVFTREQILGRLWGSTYDADLNNVTVLVSRLRRKLNGPSPEAQYIKTIWGVGYKLEVS